MSLGEMQEVVLDFFFDMFSWAFDFLTRVTVLGAPLLYILLGIMIVSVVMFGLLNMSSVSIGAGSRFKARKTREASRRTATSNKRSK